MGHLLIGELIGRLRVPAEALKRHFQHVILARLCVCMCVCVCVCVCVSFCLFRAVPKTYGGSQARGPIRDVAGGLHHNHSNVKSELCLQPTLRLMATPDPYSTEQSQGLNPHPHGY